MPTTEVTTTWTADEIGARADVAADPAGDLDEELEQLKVIETSVLPMAGSCTNATNICSGGICCL